MLSAVAALAGSVPFIARWLGGSETEKMAQEVMGIAQKITNELSPQAAVEKLKTDPRLMAEFYHALADIDKQIEERQLQDRQSARTRDIAFMQAGRHNLRADIMVVSAAGGLIACLSALTLFQQDLPGEAVGIISTIAGIFGACLKDAYAFEFGSSRGSKLKDDQITAALMGR